MSMTNECEAARVQLALLLYGELSFDEEEIVETHLENCAECRAALARERQLHAAFDSVEIEPSAALLRECRDDLRVRLGQTARRASQTDAGSVPHVGWWDKVVDTLASRASGREWLKPLGAVALLAVGFFGARLVPSNGGAFGAMSLTGPGASRVRYVETVPNGRIQIVLDETRQRTITGALDDQNIRALLLSAAKDPADPGLRVESVDILNSRAQAADVRGALLYALRHDQNAGVRLKALEGLKSFAQQPEVRNALAEVLLNDENPGLRTQAVDLLTADSDQGLDRHIVGTLQELMRTESNAYVRQRSQHVLEAINASAEIY